MELRQFDPDDDLTPLMILRDHGVSISRGGVIRPTQEQWDIADVRAATYHLVNEWDYGCEPLLPDHPVLEESVRIQSQASRILNTLLTGVGVCLMVLGVLMILRYAGWLS